MGLSAENIKKWFKMMIGKSPSHVPQPMGKFFVPLQLQGYFNDLSKKVQFQRVFAEQNTIPFSLEKKEKIYVPMEIFQYALGCYEYYLSLQNDCDYFSEFIKCARWAVDNQQKDGSWNNFFFVYPEHPYSSMCQGEGASLLVRAYKETKEASFLKAAQKAVDFMLIDIERGGTTLYYENEIILKEFVHLEPVLNGWIFSMFGLYDYWLASNDSFYKEIFDKTLLSLERRILEYDAGFWSFYDLGGHIASPFYHKLHIAQIEAILMISESKDTFNDFLNRLKDYSQKRKNRVKAFFIKAIQKIRE